MTGGIGGRRGRRGGGGKEDVAVSCQNDVHEKVFLSTPLVLVLSFLRYFHMRKFFLSLFFVLCFRFNETFAMLLNLPKGRKRIVVSKRILVRLPTHFFLCSIQICHF